MALNQYLIGYAGKVTVNGTALSVKKWTAKVMTQDLDTTSTTSGGFYEYQAGLQGCEVTVDAQWDATKDPAEAPINLQSNNYILTALQLFVNAASSIPTISAAYAKVSDVNVDLSVEAVVAYTLAAKVTGAFTFNP